MDTRSHEVKSPIGTLQLLTRGETLCALEFADRVLSRRVAGVPAAAAVPRAKKSGRNGAPALIQRLRDYFSGDIHALDGIAVEPQGTEFERKVWRALQRVRPGTTVTYGELAQSAGYPGAARAVGGACGRNPIAVVIPCHRVVGANGSLTGYGGGMERKRWLLDHEGTLATSSRASRTAVRHVHLPR